MTELLQDWVTLHAETRPDAPAVASREDHLTYAQLEARSNQLAGLLRDGGCKKGDRVCLLMPKSTMALVGILGIYKADCVFVPLDPSSPPARLAKILESCESRCVLAAGPVVHLLDQLFDDAALRVSLWVGWLGPERPAARNFVAHFALDDVRGYPNAPLEYRNTRHDPAHILFTSGSTGSPKGVVITHSNVIHFVEWACRYFRMDASDRTSGHSPLHFDLSTFDIFGTFAAGAQLHLVPPDLNLLPHKLADFIRSSELTQWFSVPSILNYLAKFDVVKPHDFPAMKRLLWCGEVFPTPALIYWMTRLPHVTFTNLYGPTEATIASSYYTVPACPADPNTEIPIGTECDGEELLVLDDRLEPVPNDEVGDLYIRGVGLSPGYWRDPERTAAAFPLRRRALDPTDRLYRTGDLARIGQDDGLVYFLGRADSQIKSRGYRIELGEIEAALNAIDGLQEAAVLGIPTGGFEGTIIACAYAPLPGRDVSPASLRKALSALLPTYMIPARWLVSASLPKNANGKIDRRALRERLQASEANPAEESRG
jgi:amino acid adenylation domain-containing protein